VLVRTVTDFSEVRAALTEIAGDQAEVEFTLDTPFVRLRAVEGLPTMVAKFSTDIPQLSNWGEPLLLGPGSIHVAHTPQMKSWPRKELLEAVEVIYQGGEAIVGVKDCFHSTDCQTKQDIYSIYL
jgi:acetylornithine deacetylase